MGFLRYFKPVRLREREADISQQKQAATGVSNGHDQLSSLVKVQPVAGKGLGLIATTLIKRGQRVLEEAPGETRQAALQPPAQKLGKSFSCRIPAVMWDSAGSDELDNLASNANAPSPGLSRTNTFPKRACLKSPLPCVMLPDPDFEGRPMIRPGMAPHHQVAGLTDSVGSQGMRSKSLQRHFPLISQINHSCLPNVHVSWNPFHGKEVVHAVTDIQPGQEILTTYVALDADSATRQQLLLARFGFCCTCAACSLPEKQQALSDRRRLLMAQLDRCIPALATTQPSEALACAQALARLVSREGVADTSLQARAYYDAYQICLSNPGIGDAAVFARAAFKCYLVCRGPDSSETLRLRAFACNPHVHPASKTPKSTQQHIASLQQSIEAGGRAVATDDGKKRPATSQQWSSSPNCKPAEAAASATVACERRPGSVTTTSAADDSALDDDLRPAKAKRLQNALSAGAGKVKSLLSRSHGRSKAADVTYSQEIEGEKLLPSGSSSSPLDTPREPSKLGRRFSSKIGGKTGGKNGWTWRSGSLKRPWQLLS